MMFRPLAALAALLLLAACSDGPASVSIDPGSSGPRLAASGVDADGDGLDDGTEWDLANQFAPVMYMPTLITRTQAGNGIPGDWTWPATVDWYLPQVRMRIHHNNCSDHQFLNFGEVNATNLLQQAHQRYVRGVFGCDHENPVQYSDTSFHRDDHYFLQAGVDDVVHPGIRDPSQWKAYVHSYRNDAGGVTLQYWFFYAYNDWHVGNHEGDWEHVTVKLNDQNSPLSVTYSHHGNLSTYLPSEVTWYESTHPQAWVADGSHANYRSEASCDATTWGVNTETCYTNASERWFTWTGGRGTALGIQGAGLVQLGEKALPAPGQQWIRYSGRWGEKGEVDGSSGPQGPAYQPSHWYLGAPSTGGGGGGGGGDCPPEGGPNQPPQDEQPVCPL